MLLNLHKRLHHRNKLLAISSVLILAISQVSVLFVLNPSTAEAADPKCYSRFDSPTRSVPCASDKANDRCYLQPASGGQQNLVGLLTGASCKTLATQAGAAGSAKCYQRVGEEIKTAICASTAQAGKCYLRTTGRGAFTLAGDVSSATCTSLASQAEAAAEEDQTLGAGGTDGCSGTVNLQNCVKNNPIVTKVLRPIVLFLTAVVAIVIIGSLIVAGIQYSAAQDNPQMVQKSKDRIRNALIALGAFMFALAGLQYLIPGGIISL